MTPPQEIPEGSVVVTPTQMYAEMRDMHDEIRKLGSLVDPALAEIRSDIADNKADRIKVDADHETRLRAVERRLWQIGGAALVLGPTAGVLADILRG